MPSLLDPLSDDAQRLVDVIADAYAKTDQWPVWQYVALTLDAEGINADTVLQRLPTWQHHYRPVLVMGSGGGNIPPELTDRPLLTIHGLFHARNPVAARLVAAFVAAVQAAYDQQRAVQPSPLEVQPVMITASALMAEVAARTGVKIGDRQLGLMLSREPATWIGINGGDREDWQWDLSRRSLRRYAAATTGEQYLTVLEELVGVTVSQPALFTLPPEALPRAIDHLDVAWLAATRKRLFRLRGAARVSALTLPANSGEEFESRCSALADVLGSVSLDGDQRVGSLNLLKQHLEDKLPPASAPRAVTAVDRLRNVVAIRRGQQHSGASDAEAKATVSLGLHLADPPSVKWDHLRSIAVEALVAITEEVETLLPT